MNYGIFRNSPEVFPRFSGSGPRCSGPGQIYGIFKKGPTLFHFVVFLGRPFFRSGFSGPRCSGSLRTKLRYEAMSTRLHVLDVYEARLSCSVYEARSTRLHVLELEPKWLPQHTFSTLHVLTRFAPQVESCASKLSYTCYIDIWCLSWVAGLLPSPYMHQASCINICNMRI